MLTRFDLWPAALVAGALASLSRRPLTTRARAARRGHRREGLAGRARAADGRVRVADARPARGALVRRARRRRRPRCGRAAVLRPLAARRVDELRAPALAAAADREHRRRVDRRVASRVRHRRRHGLEPRLAERRRRVRERRRRRRRASSQLGVLVGIWVAFARRDRSREELVRYAAAAVVAFVALGKVLSPQFLIWLIPLVPLVRRWSVALLYAAALVLTQAWFPKHYWSYALQFGER